MTLETN